MFTRVLENISRSTNEEPGYFRAEDLNNILAWVTFSPTPLSLFEIDAITKLSSDEDESILNMEDSLRFKYSSLFTLDDNIYRRTVDARQYVQDDPAGMSHEAINPKSKDRGEDVAPELVSRTDWREIYLSFCHASVGQYFRDKSRKEVSYGSDFPGIGYTASAAKIRLLNTSLKLICHPDRLGESPARDAMCTHVLDNWLQYLEYATEDIETISPERRNTTATNLLQILDDDQVLDFWAGRNFRFSLKKFRQLQNVARWLELDSIPALSQRQQTLAHSIIKHPSLVLDRVVQAQGRIWLLFDATQTISHQNRAEAILSIIRILALTSGQPDPFEHDIVSAQEIRDAASAVDLEHDYRWFDMLGTTLYQFNHFLEAEKELQTALTMNQGSWRVRMSKTLLELHRSNYDQAIEEALDCLSVAEQCPVTDVPTSLEDVTIPKLNRLYNLTGYLYSLNGELDSATEYTGRAIATGMDDDLELWPFHFSNLAAQGRYQEVWGFVDRLSQPSTATKPSNRSQLTQLLFIRKEVPFDLLYKSFAFAGTYDLRPRF